MANCFRLAGLALAMILILSSSGLAGQLFLNVYVDDTSANKALIVGNVDDISCLLFLNTSGQIHEDDGQLYAVCDSLLKKDGLGWILEFPAKGYYDEYHAVFYIPGGFEFQEINCTRGLEFLSTTYNGSLVLDVQGFDPFDPVVSLRYSAA